MPCMDEEPTWDDDLRELVNRLFAAATGMLEDAVEPADAVSHHGLPYRSLAENGRRLQIAAREIIVIAEAATIVATMSDAGTPRPTRTTPLKALDLPCNRSMHGHQ